MTVKGIEILILPFEGTAKGDLQHLIQGLAEVGMQASLLPEAAIPAQAYNPQRDQYVADVMLHRTREAGVHLPVLGVTEVDLYVAGLNYVFGMADLPGHAAVISLHRLRLDADADCFRDRAVKEAVHEMGHTFGLKHCDDRHCVMYFSFSLADTDRKGKAYCPQCQARLAQA